MPKAASPQGCAEGDAHAHQLCNTASPSKSKNYRGNAGFICHSGRGKRLKVMTPVGKRLTWTYALLVVFSTALCGAIFNMSVWLKLRFVPSAFDIYIIVYWISSAAWLPIFFILFALKPRKGSTWMNLLVGSSFFGVVVLSILVGVIIIPVNRPQNCVINSLPSGKIHYQCMVGSDQEQFEVDTGSILMTPLPPP